MARRAAQLAGGGSGGAERRLPLPRTAQASVGAEAPASACCCCEASSWYLASGPLAGNRGTTAWRRRRPSHRPRRRRCRLMQTGALPPLDSATAGLAAGSAQGESGSSAGTGGRGARGLRSGDLSLDGLLEDSLADVAREAGRAAGAARPALRTEEGPTTAGAEESRRRAPGHGGKLLAAAAATPPQTVPPAGEAVSGARPVAEAREEEHSSEEEELCEVPQLRFYLACTWRTARRCLHRAEVLCAAARRTAPGNLLSLYQLPLPGATPRFAASAGVMDFRRRPRTATAAVPVRLLRAAEPVRRRSRRTGWAALRLGAR